MHGFLCGYIGLFGHTFYGYGRVWGGIGESIRLFYKALSRARFSFRIYRFFLDIYFADMVLCGGG